MIDAAKALRIGRMALVTALSLGIGSFLRLALPVQAATQSEAVAEQAAEAEHGFLLLHLVPGLEHAPFHVVGAVFAAIVVALVGWIGTAAIRSGRADLVPSDRLTLRNALELFVGGIDRFLADNIGHESRRYLPLVGTLAFFILFANLIGNLPGFLPPTEHVGTTATLALVVFVMTHVIGVREHGAGYLKHFLGPIWWLAPMFLVIEVISHLARPLSLSIRLFGNIYGDHQALGVFAGLVPLLVPIPFMVLGFFVAFMQTFVFCLMTTLYIAGAVSHEEH